VETEEDQFAQIEVSRSPLKTGNVKKVVPVEQNAQNHRLQGSNQVPTHVDSYSELGDISEGVANTKDNAFHETEGEIMSDLDGETDDSISALEEPYIVSPKKTCIKDEEKRQCAKDQGVNQHQRRSSTQMNLNCETITVAGAGKAGANGVYRWFAAHERFVKFTDQGQWQVMRGVNLIEYGDCYYDCWVIEEIKDNVIRLYAVPSGESNSISTNGWICIDGVLPAPTVIEGRDCNECIESDESNASISPMPTSYNSKEWPLNNLDGGEGVKLGLINKMV